MKMKRIDEAMKHINHAVQDEERRREDMTVEVDGGRFDGRRFVLHIIVHGDRLGFVVQEQSYRHVDPPVRASQVEASE